MKFIAFLTIAILVVTSCRKEECEAFGSLYVTTDGDVYEGWPLKLYSETTSNYRVQISGPNGFYRKFSEGEYYSGVLTIDSTTAEHSGNYTIEYWEGECLIRSGTVNVSILPAPTPPCNMSNNTGTSSIGGIGPTSYNYAYGSAFSGYYRAYGASGTSNQMNFTFNGTSRPAAGKYKSSGSYFPEEGIDQCSVQLITSMYDFFILDNQDIYVNYVNNQLVITMCPSEFFNSISSTPLYISAKIVVP